MRNLLLFWRDHPVSVLSCKSFSMNLPLGRNPMSQYRTVFRVTQFKEFEVAQLKTSLGLVWGTMIAWKNEPFWYPATLFVACVSRQEILTVTHQNPLRFICDANIYADDIDGLDIKNVKISE